MSPELTRFDRFRFGRRWGQTGHRDRAKMERITQAGRRVEFAGSTLQSWMNVKHDQLVAIRLLTANCLDLLFFSPLLGCAAACGRHLQNGALGALSHASAAQGM